MTNMRTPGEELSAMRETRETTRGRSGESGFALLLAILSLMLLTFLGLTLAATTSTELQIATNYRWSLQAFYNAEAGIEAGKRVLQTINWRAALPAARGSWAPPTTTPVPTTNQPVPPFAGGTRNFEMGLCDQRGFGAGYGVVLNDGITRTRTSAWCRAWAGRAPSTGRSRCGCGATSCPTPAVAGAVHRQHGRRRCSCSRPRVSRRTSTRRTSAFTQQNVARRIVEVVVRRQDRPGDCAGRGGQLSGGPEGNNLMNGCCDALDPNAMLDNLKTSSGGFLAGTGTAR